MFIPPKKSSLFFLLIAALLTPSISPVQAAGSIDISNNNHDPALIGLPPDPGEEGLKTLLGIDSDKDGVRDDVQRFIAVRFKESKLERGAATQLAKSLQLANTSPRKHKIIDHMDLFNEMDKATVCLAGVFPPDIAGGISREISEAMENTKDRVSESAHRKKHNSVYESIWDEEKPPCDF